MSLQLGLKDCENSLTRFRIAGSRIWLAYLGERLLETTINIAISDMSLQVDSNLITHLHMSFSELKKT